MKTKKVNISYSILLVTLLSIALVGATTVSDLGINTPYINIDPYILYVNGEDFTISNGTTDIMVFNKSANEMFFTTNTRTMGFTRGASPLKLEEGLQFFDEDGTKHYSIYHAHGTEEWINVSSIFEDAVVFELEEEGNLYGMEWVLWDKTDQRPHLVVNHGASSRASIFDRSLMVGKSFGNASLDENYTLCEGFNLIDCMTSSTGADLGVEDDIEAKGSILAQENITATYFIGDGSLLTGISGTDATNLTNYALKNQSEIFAGNITTSNYGFFGWLGSLANRVTKLWVDEINATGNISADYFIGDGSELTDVNTITQSTGLIQGGAVSINSGDNTLIDISAGSGQVVDSTTNPDNPVLTTVTWTAKTGYNLATTASAGDVIAIFLSLDSSGNVVERLELPTPEERRDTIDLGIAGRNDTNHITFAGSGPLSIIHNPTSQLQDFFQAWGPFNVEGNQIQPNTGADLQIKKLAGSVFRSGANFQTDGKNPHIVDLAEQSPTTFNYKLSDGTDVTFSAYIDPDSYDDGTSTLATVPNNKWTVQYVAVFASGLVEVLYGQEVFDTESDAVTTLSTMDFTIPTDSKGGVPLAYLVLQQSDTILPEDRFYRISRVGTGGTGGTTYSAGTGIEISNSLINLNTTYTDDRYVNIDGDNITGNLNMTSNNITSVDCITFKSGGRICNSP